MKNTEQGQNAGEQFFASLDFVALDLETTGLNPDKDEIIEIAAVRFKNGIKTDVFQSFVRPRRDIPKFIQYLTHIDPKQLDAAPTIDRVLNSLLEFVGNAVIVGHNVGFDIGFVNQALMRQRAAVLTNESWDTAELSRIYLPYTSDHTLGTICRHLGVELIQAHRADADAEASGEVLLHLAQHIVNQHSMITNARLYEIGRQSQSEETGAKFLYRVVEWQRRNLGAKKQQSPFVGPANIIEHQAPAKHLATMEEVFGPGGLLEQKFDGYEYRGGQLQMGNATQKAFAENRHLAVEAGTGVGKSFAYLVPAIQHAAKAECSVVVSTNTKNLQEQLFFKDIPMLQKILPVSFKAVLVKGRENYICQKRWNDLLQEQTKGLTPWEARGLLYLFIWKSQTQTGDLSENSSFDRKRFSQLWRKINSDRYSCMGRKCPMQNECYVMKLRKHIESANIVVANHSLLLADLSNENTTLGEYTHLVIDEAHNLPDTASKLMGFELSYMENSNALYQLNGSGRKRSGFIQQMEHSLARSALPQASKDHAGMLLLKLAEDVEKLRKLSTDLFQEAQNRTNEADSFGKLRIKSTESLPALFDILKEMAASWKQMMKDLQALQNVFGSFNSQLIFGLLEINDTLDSMHRRLSETEGKLLMLLNPDLENSALWLETDMKSERNTPSASFNYAPVEVDKSLNDLLYSKVGSIVFTSATLALRGSFKYFFNQSGLHLTKPEKIEALIVDSPFDYDAQSKLMVSSFLPEHKDRFFLNQALSCLEQILKATEVGTMMLFTSYRDLNSVYDHIGDMLYHRGRPFFAQGKIGSRSSILQEFKNHKNAVLLGTSSFWEGVDVQGESLSLLILFKLPFLVPSDPIVEAYIDKLERDGKDSFMHYMLPNALLRLRQGFGRLIRSKTDRGAVLIMDSRVSTKKYGNFFKQVLPTRCLELRSELELINEITALFNRP